LRINFGGAHGIVFSQCGIGCLQQILFLGADRAFGDPLQECNDLTLGQRTHEPVDRLTV